MKKDQKNSSLIHELEQGSTSNNRKKEILTELIDRELEKSEAEADLELVQECLDYLAFLDNQNLDASTREEQLQIHLQRIYQKAETAEQTTLATVQPRLPARKRRVRSFRIAVAVFAAVLVLTGFCLVTIANVSGSESVWSWFSERLRGLSDETTDPYWWVESWPQTNEWDVLSAYVDRDGIGLEDIFLEEPADGETQIAQVRNASIMRTSVKNVNPSILEPAGKTEIIEKGGYRFILSYTPDGGYQAICVVGDFAYSISCMERAELLSFIDQLESPE